MKRNKLSLAIGASLLLPSVFINNIYAASPSIIIDGDQEDLYVSEGTKSNTGNTATYDASSNTITLNNFVGSSIKITSLEEITINLVGDNVLDMATLDGNSIPQGITASNVNLTITGEGKLSVNQENLSGFATSATVIRANSITISQATLDLTAPTKTCLNSNNSWTSSAANGNISINSGTVKLSCNVAMQAENININGGDVEINGALSNVYSLSKNLTVSGGRLVVNGENINLGSAMTFSGTVIFNGGSTEVHGGQCGVGFTNLSDTAGAVGSFQMKGGELQIDKADKGVCVDDASENSYIEFSGGTTVINAKNRAAEIVYRSGENEKNIILGNNLYFTPSDISVSMDYKDYSGVWEEYIYYLASNSNPAKSVIITDIEPEDDSDSATDKEEDKEEDKDEEISVPNTGLFTGKDNGLKAGGILFIATSAITGISIVLAAIHRIFKKIKSKKF
ncbi:hypothetical protein IKF88_01390 [Candidatus Saccharibacteria bacterium]|nr:hypothetical protein [Candidatus Saccharibacteria bacterium]